MPNNYLSRTFAVVIIRSLYVPEHATYTCYIVTAVLIIMFT